MSIERPFLTTTGNGIVNRRDLVSPFLFASIVLATLFFGLPCLPGFAGLQEDPQPVQQSADANGGLNENIVDKIESLSRSARTAKSATGYSTIIEQCEQILATEPDNAEHVRYLKSLKSWSLNRRAQTRMELADRFAKIGNVEQANQVRQSAQSDLDAAIEFDNSKWQAFRNRAQLLTLKEQYEAAIADWNQVVDLKKGTSDAITACFNRAELLAFVGRHEEALADYRMVLQSNNEDLQAINGCGNCLLALSKPREAIEQYDRILAQQPENANALVNRGDARQQLKQWAQARDDYRDSIESDVSGRTLQRLAWLMATCPDEQIADSSAAMDAIRKAISIDGETAINLDTMAAALAATGDFDQARDIQTRVIALSESNDDQFKVRQTMYENKEPFRQDDDK